MHLVFWKLQTSVYVWAGGGLHMQWSMCGGQNPTCGNLLSPSTLWISETDFTSGLGASYFNSWAILQAPASDLRLLLFSAIVLSYLFVCLFTPFSFLTEHSPSTECHVDQNKLEKTNFVLSTWLQGSILNKLISWQPWVPRQIFSSLLVSLLQPW